MLKATPAVLPKLAAIDAAPAVLAITDVLLAVSVRVALLTTSFEISELSIYD